jgi:hypothetical protein
VATENYSVQYEQMPLQAEHKKSKQRLRGKANHSTAVHEISLLPFCKGTSVLPEFSGSSYQKEGKIQKIAIYEQKCKLSKPTDQPNLYPY